MAGVSRARVCPAYADDVQLLGRWDQRSRAVESASASVGAKRVAVDRRPDWPRGRTAQRPRALVSRLPRRGLSQEAVAEDARSAELEAAISGFLRDPQVKRLKQIGLQQQGAWALADPKIADGLGLTAAQKEEVRSLTTAARFKMRGFGTPGRSPNRENAESVRRATSDKLLALLTAEQQTKWKNLVGKPFEGEIRRP